MIKPDDYVYEHGDGEDRTFFANAAMLFRHPSPVVANTANALHWHMKSQFDSNGLAPIPSFNIYYFFQSVIRLRSPHPIDRASASRLFPVACMPIRAANIPMVVEDYLRQYVSLVVADSTEAGSDFDVGYAVRIVSLAITPALELRSLGEDAVTSEEFDANWLAGFNDVGE